MLPSITKALIVSPHLHQGFTFKAVSAAPRRGKLGKPFFYRIDAAEFAAAVLQIPDGEHKQWITQLALDMVSGVGNMDFSRKIIEEVENYRKKQAEAGAKGGKPKHKRPYSDPIAEVSDPIATPYQNIANNNNNTETYKTLSASDDAEQEIFITKKKKRLSGKRLETFNQFWDAFAYKKGKAEAADAWLEIPSMTMATVEEIVAAAKMEAENRHKLEAAGKTPKMAQGWLSGRRWEDEREPEAWRQNY